MINKILTLRIVFGVVFGVGLFVYIAVNNGYKACQSGIGVLAQSLDQQAANDCQANSFAHWIALAIMAAAIIGFALTFRRSRKTSIRSETGRDG